MDTALKVNVPASCCSMRAAVVEHAWGIGAGSFSFPSVPPNSPLTYEVELLDFDAVDEVWLSSICRLIRQPWDSS